MKTFELGMKLKGFHLSEKYDGVQGRWDGRVLKTRSGNIIKAPQWWLAELPPEHLVGELWIGRGLFDLVSGIVRGSYDAEWEQVRFMVFDGDFYAAHESKYCSWVIQREFYHLAVLTAAYSHVLSIGGEGLVVRKSYDCSEIYKMKPESDMDARVIGHVEGKGRNAERMGALMVETKEGRTFKVGSGFSDKDRDCPPSIGAIIKVFYNGFTSKGLPRFARFSGVRAEHLFV